MKTKLFFFESKDGNFNQKEVQDNLKKEGYRLEYGQMVCLNVPPYGNHTGFVFLGIKEEPTPNNN